MDSSALAFFCLLPHNSVNFGRQNMAGKPGYIDNSAWALAHVDKVLAKTNPSKDDKLFMLLMHKPDRTPVDNRSLAALIRVERAKETVRAGRGAIRQAASVTAKADRRERDHQRFLAAGLMTKAGLLDSQTGIPTWDRATLLGALDAMAQVDASEDQQRRWKARGDALLAKTGDDTENTSEDA
jgi:hypothetical protein